MQPNLNTANLNTANLNSDNMTLANESSPNLNTANLILPNLILFDGVCVLCNGWARFVAKHDTKKIFRLATAQSDMGQQIYLELGLSPVTFDTLVVLLNGRYHTDSDAVLTVLREIGGMWRTTAVLRLIPVPLRDWAYRHIARRRYQLFGRHETCPLPDANLKSRLL